jgi:hypothetical protein
MADMNELLAAKLMSEDDHDGFLGGNGLGFLIIILLFFFVLVATALAVGVTMLMVHI